VNRLENWVARLASWFNGVASAAVVGMMLLTCLDVVLRFLRHPIPGTYEIVGMLGAVFVSFSLARTTVDRGHIAVDFLVQRLPAKIQNIVEAVNAGICALLFIVVSRQCLLYALDLKSSGEVSMTLQMPIHPFVSGIALGCTMLSLVLAVNCAAFSVKAVRANAETMSTN
jgi:TRAP-type C4-dicarboxylate transport system permease small subunit